MKKLPPVFALTTWLALAAHAQATTLTVQSDAVGKPISPDLFGVFFEDINYSADGGLYAELVQNRSFEYTPEDSKGWNSLSAWEPVRRGDGQGSVIVETSAPLNANNPHYAVIEVQKAGAGVGLQNFGFDGIALKAGEKYNLTLFARQLSGSGGPLVARLERKDGSPLAEASLPRPIGDWKKYTVSFEVGETVPDARLVVLATGEGRLALDEVSLFPQKTFQNRANGLRADLAQVIADLHPRFVRFPGGCVAHGDGLANMYRWKNTIGPVEQRVQQRNLWNYHQSAGLGYFEYFQFCEDIGAKPLPVVAAGVCCQNSNVRVTHKWGTGQKALPISDMPGYIQEVLDLIEYANGPAGSKWGALRAAAGHPEPFHLEYLGIGNEDKITPDFRDRFKMIYDAVKAKHPEITVVGTVGPFTSGPDYDEGWKFADELHLPMVDEHGYEPPQWFWENQSRYDSYDRAKSKVYLGEYAAHDVKRLNTLRSALSEAAYMTGLERNGDVVHMASYAPLLAKIGHTQWNPNLIYYTNTEIFPTINYYVQQMFGRNAGDTWLPVAVGEPSKDLAVSAVRESKSGDLIVKIVNGAATPSPLRIDLDAKKGALKATATVLAGDAMAVNTPNSKDPLGPKTMPISAAPSFNYEAPANSLSVLRLSENHTSEPPRAK